MRYWTAAALAALAGAASAATPASPTPGPAPGPAAAYHLAAPVPLSAGGWDLVSFDPVLRRLYIARGDGVTALDADTGKLTAKLAPAARGHAAIPVKDGAEILVTEGASNSATFRDSRTGAEIATLKVGTNPDAAVFDPATGLAVVMNAKSGSLSLIDPVKHAVVGEIPVGGSLELGAVDGTGRLYVNVEDRNELVVIDLKGRKVLAHVPLTGCEEPTGIAWLPVSQRLLSSCGNGVAAVTDPAGRKLEALLPIGAGPDTVAYDGRRRLALIPAGRAGELDLFSDTPGGVRPAGKLATHLGARTGAVDERTGRFYAPAADYDPPAAAGGRPRIKPGSETLVVVTP